MKLTLEGEPEIMQIMDTLTNRGHDPEETLSKVRMYADQAMVSAAKADAAARNTEMAADNIEKIKQGEQT